MEKGLKVKLILGVFLIFLLGGIVGALGTGIYVRHKIVRMTAVGPSGRRAWLMKRLVSRLDLTNRQREEIERILEQSQERMLEIRERYLPEIRQVDEQSMILIREKLNPDQRQRLERLRKRVRRWRRRIFHEPKGGRKAPEELFSEIKGRLHLGEDQAERVRPVFISIMEKRREILRRFSDQRRQEERALRRALQRSEQEEEARLAEILSGRQMEAYRKFRGTLFQREGQGPRGFFSP